MVENMLEKCYIIGENKLLIKKTVYEKVIIVDGCAVDVFFSYGTDE